MKTLEKQWSFKVPIFVPFHHCREADCHLILKALAGHHWTPKDYLIDYQMWLTKGTFCIPGISHQEYFCYEGRRKAIDAIIGHDKQVEKFWPEIRSFVGSTFFDMAAWVRDLPDPLSLEQDDDH
jgi:hypothetical protein